MIHSNIVYIRPNLVGNYSIKSRHYRYLNLLQKMATSLEPVGGARVCACLVHHNHIISFGSCKCKSHPFQAKHGRNASAIYLHAEIDCIKNALRDSSVTDIAKMTLYVARAKYNDRDKTNFVQGLAKPCDGCMKAIVSFGINRVYYSLNNEGFDQL